MVDTGKMYKGLEVYCCLALNRIASQLGIDIYQHDLEGKLEDILEGERNGIPKVEISHELRSNHHMTSKVLEVLQDDGLVMIDLEDRAYKVRITKKGIMHLRKFNEFYSIIFRRYIVDHYKYSDLPRWFIQD
jgi:predicted transcriptional regulator